MYSNILVPVDDSATAALGVAEAIKVAKNQGATVRVIHIVNELIMTGPLDFRAESAGRKKREL